MANTLNVGNGDWATKENSLLGYNSENGNYKPLPFDFTRASNGTFVNKSGLIETAANGVPRIDFSDSTSGALLLELQRTNLIPYSEGIDIGWSKLNVTVANNQTVSPDGTLNAALSTVTSTNGQHASYDTLSSSVTSGQPYYISCFVKKSNTRYIRLNEGYTGDQLYYDFDNNIATLGGGASDKIVEDFGNGWFRIGFKFVPTTVNSQFALYLNDNSNNNSYAGSGEDVYIYGAQIEQGSYATSYIPTSGSAVTRVADACTNGANAQVINSTEGVLYIEAKVKTDTIFAANCIAVSDGTDANRLSIIMYGNINSIRASMNVGGVSQFDFNLSSGYIQEQYYKIAVSYKANDCKIFINGVKILTDTSATMPSLETFDRLNLDLGQGLYDFYGNVKDSKLYNTALTDAELIALTS